jgi:hypothetical protein
MMGLSGLAGFGAVIDDSSSESVEVKRRAPVLTRARRRRR